MMKRIFALLLILSGINQPGTAQTTPFTGGDGSGYLSRNSPPVICSNFFGGNADGAILALSAPTICPSFFGGNDDGATLAISAPTICPSFFGGDADGYSGSQTVGCNILLAEKLINFYGEKDLHRNVLHWKVTEFNVKLFEVQKSSDAVTFTAFGTVAGSTNNDIVYLFIDNAPFPNITYYRLRITDRNSLVSYSDIVPLKDVSAAGSSIYPNPTQGLSMLSYYAERTQSTTLSIAQMNGKNVSIKTIALKAGKNNIPLDLQYFPNGIYLVRIGSNGKAFKLIVSR